MRHRKREMEQRFSMKNRKRMGAYTAWMVIAVLFAGLLAGCGTVDTGAVVSMDETQSSTAAVSSAMERADESGSAGAGNVGASAEGKKPEEEKNSASSVAQKLLGELSLREKIFQMFIVTHEQITGVSNVTRSGEQTKDAIERLPVGGIIYFEPNIVSPEQCSNMIENLQSYSKLGLFIAVDEEGGRVARLGNNPDMNTTAFPGGQAAIGRTGEPEKARQVGKTIGHDISQYGFNLNLAPVAEITDDTEHSVIGARSFGGDPELVSQMVSEMVTGMHEGGVLCTLKHFPGHGDTTSDPHDGYTETSKSLEELEQQDFLPFRAGVQAGAEFLMMGHFSAPQLTGDDVPATLSETMISLAREELGFQGLIMTDSLSMGAITDRYSSGEAAVTAVQAGADVILMPVDLESAVNALEEAVSEGALSEKRIDESVEKILTVKVEHGIIT